MKVRAVFPIIAVFSLLTSNALAQGWVTAPPLYGTFHLTAGFTPDPHSVWAEAGGSWEAASLGTPANCVGMIMIGQPDVRVHFTAGTGYPLRFYVESTGDTTLIVNGPDGSWHCNDDAVELSHVVDFQYAMSGQYDIWIGVWNSTAIFPATLYITEILTNGPYGETPTAGTSRTIDPAMPDDTTSASREEESEFHYQDGDIVTRLNVGVDLLTGVGETSQFLEALSVPIELGFGYYPVDRISVDLGAAGTIHGDEGFTNLSAGLGSHIYVIPELFIRAAAPIVFDPFSVNGLFGTGVDILVADGTSVTTEVGFTYPLTCDNDVSCGGGALTFGGGTAFAF